MDQRVTQSSPFGVGAATRISTGSPVFVVSV